MWVWPFLDIRLTDDEPVGNISIVVLDRKTETVTFRGRRSYRRVSLIQRIRVSVRCVVGQGDENGQGFEV